MVVNLCLELLPLRDKLKSQEAELLAKYNSSSNMAISVLNIPLKWRLPDGKKKMFSTPCLVVDSKCSLSDSMVRLGMATVRDLLRSGRSSKNSEEHKTTINDPAVFHAWEKCRRELYMSEAESYEVVEKGEEKIYFHFSTITWLVRTSGPCISGGIAVREVAPYTKQNYCAFSRGDKLIIRKRDGGVGKYNLMYVVPPKTEVLLGEGAPASYHAIISQAIAASVSADTKSGYSTALRMLALCQSTLGRVMELPMSDSDVLCFVAFMAQRNVLDTTISKYLSAIRYALLCAGHECENLRTSVVKQVLKGIHNLRRDPSALVQKKTRRAMTVFHLRLLGHALATSNMSAYLKSALWAVSLSAFWGSLRIGEVLGPLVKAFDPKSSLLLSDVGISEKGYKLWIRSPKKCTPSGDVIELFHVPDGGLDPVKAINHYMETRRRKHGCDGNIPFFLEEDGRILTKQKFNKLLHGLLGRFLKDERDKITGHSFRSGLATLMEAAGFSEMDIKAWGRWSSEAFRKYCKENRPRDRIFAMLYPFI